MGREGNLLSTAAGEGDAEVGGAMAFPVGTTAGELAAAQRPDEHASSENFPQGGEVLDSAVPAVKEVSHILQSYRRKILESQASR